MKYTILVLALVITGCTDKSPVETNVVGLKTELREAQYNLAACQNSLSVYRNSGNDTPFNPSEKETPEEPATPEYEDVDVYIVDGTKCYASENQGEAPACGRGFWKCNDGKIRECMVNVKYEIKTEKKLIEQE